ncbi:hypothetical protein [Sporosarcina sp. FSL K6-3457]|uniref:hypothetical protein n=1 Tax=Sporosarcina sp. FSL K6-3457 TaxID=2978204 RepID=UPI0030FBD2D8
MKLENYKRDDISDVLEIKRMILHQLESIETNLWTDNVDEALKRTVDMHLSLVSLTRLQSSKRLEDAFRKAGMNGIHVSLINFGHKKTD